MNSFEQSFNFGGCKITSLLYNYFCHLFQIPKRLMLALSLLKKEYELSKLQHKIGKEVRQTDIGSGCQSLLQCIPYEFILTFNRKRKLVMTTYEMDKSLF